MFLASLFLPTTGAFLLKNQDIQNYLVDKLSQKFSQKLNAHIQIKSAYYTLFNKIVLEDVYIEDQKGDSLIYSQSITGNLNFLSLKNRELFFEELALENARIKLYNDTSKNINIHFLIEALKRSDTTKPRMHIRSQNIRISNSTLSYHTPHKPDATPVIDPHHLMLKDLNLQIGNLNADSGRVSMNLEHLSFEEISGLTVQKLTTGLKLDQNQLVLNNLSLQTPATSFQTDSIRLTHQKYEGFDDPFRKLQFELSIKPSEIAFNDLSCLSTVFQKTPGEQFTLSGNFSGKINNLKGHQVHLGLGSQTELLTDFSLDGLPDISKTFMYVDVNHLYTGMADLKVINRFLPGDEEINLPEAFSNLGRIRYQGNFTGFIDDFVAYGKINSQLGEISTDLLIKPRQVKGLTMNGNLKTRNFDIGGLLENKEDFGQFSMDIQVRGSILKDKSFRAQTDGNIQKLEINNYNYQNIKLDGLLTENKYDGSLSIEDPNVQFDFQGGIDFSGEMPVFDFKAELTKAKLHQLNFAPKDTSANLSLSLMSNFRGNSLDNASGTIRLFQGKLVKNDKSLQFDNLQVEARHQQDTHQISLTSDHLEAKLVGKYRSTTVYQSLKNLTFSYLPVLIRNPQDTTSVNYENDFELALDLNHTHQITDIFMPSLQLADSSKIQLDYHGGQNKSFHLSAHTKSMQVKGWDFKNLTLDSRSQDTIFALDVNFDKVLTLSDKPTEYLNRFRLKSLTGENESKLMVQWNQPNQDTLKGELISLIEMGRNDITNNLKTNIFILPGAVSLNDETWHVSQSSVVIDSSSINFNNLNFYHQQQRMFVDGRITKEPSDTLQVDFSDISLDYANILFPKGNMIFEGKIHGNASFSNLYKEPSFHTNLTVDTLFVNHQKIGQTQFLSSWNNQDKTIDVGVESKRGTLKTIDIKGQYKPTDQSIKFDLGMDKLRLEVLNPILKNALSNFRGAVSGNLEVGGSIRQPVFNGKISAQKTSFTINYLQTRYHLTHILEVANNSLLFRETQVTDDEGNTARVDGQLRFNSLKNIDYTFIIDANELKALNTSGLDNNIYYGKAFASGLVNIEGNTQTKDLNIEASLTTDEDTRINLPVGDRGRSQKARFITFTDSSKEKDQPIKEQERYRTNLSGLSMNFDLEVTPQARTRLIFDPELRDIIEASGRGNLNMEVDNSGDFRIYGNYTIEEGDYMFSLKNVINKEFEIEQGSQIIWNGQPQDADINITAVYNLRTSLNNLFMDTTSFYNKRIPVECRIQLTEKLDNPNIQFDINLPTADENTRARLQSAINTEEELNKQFLSLLVLNTFMPSQQYLAGQSDAFDMGATGMAFTTSELLSNQLSHWLSQISNNWDIGVNYQTGDEISKDQMEVALSTQLLNNRLIINGNVGTSGKYQQASELVGDFRVDWKLTPNGKLRLKFFNRNSDRLIYEETRYIQGAGLFYREEFNSFRELLHNMARDLSSKKKKERANKE